jgi:dimethylglycine dehydrogenase
VARSEAGLPELPVMRDPEQSFYVRQEVLGLAMGCYEGRGETMFVDGVPPDFGQDTLPRELDKMLPFVEKAVERVPPLDTAGIMAVTNFPMPYTPDDMPTTGPAFGLRNFWLAEGNPFGVTLAGGIGWQIVEWIVEGEPSIDMWPCDSRRYGLFATRRYSARKTEEAYEHTYRIPKPEEELPAARLLKTTPIHDLLAARGAVFGAVYGWERPNWYAPEGVEPVDVCSFYRPNYFEHIGAECRNARSDVGIADVSHAARFAATGPGAEDMLKRVLCTRLPGPGHVAVGYALSTLGTVRSEFSVVREDEARFLLTSAAGAERYDLDLLQKACSDHGAFHIENLTGREGGLAVFGPRAAELIAQVAEVPTSEIAGIDVASATVGYAPARIVRAGVGGEEGWEVQAQAEFLRHIFLALMEAGAALGIRLIGARALNSLRLEAGTAAWGADVTRGFTALESGLEPLIDFDQTEFRGRKALCRQRQAGLQKRLVCLEVSGNEQFDPRGQEPVRVVAGETVGQTTSGGFGHCLGMSLAMAYLDTAAIDAASELEIKLMNDWFPASVRSDAQ